MTDRSAIQDAIHGGGGLLRLEPCWVPRSFMHPGRRLRLHPDDLYAFGAHRGGINERWFSSTTNADNGPGTPADEGLSYVRHANGERFLLKEAVEQAGDLLLGADVMAREKGWNLLCKFFDNMGPIPHHMHQSDEHASAGRPPRQARGVLFPAAVQPDRQQLSLHLHGPRAGHDERRCPAVPRELEQGRQRHPVPVARLPAGARQRLADRSRHSPRAGLAPHLRAAGQQRRLRDVPVARSKDGSSPWDLLVKDVPPEQHQDLDYIIGMLDWDANVNPRFGASNRYFPKPVKPFAETEPDGYREQWISYGTPLVLGQGTDRAARSARVTIKDAAAYGLILTQGHGTFGRLQVSTPAMIRFGQMTEDELFVTADAAAGGVRIENRSETDPLVILKHFGPGNPDASRSQEIARL